MRQQWSNSNRFSAWILNATKPMTLSRGCTWPRRKREEAQQLLQQALAAHPDASALLARLGILLLNAGNPAQASEYLERAIREDPDHAEAYYSLGQAYLRIGLSDRGHAVLHYFELLQNNYRELLT